MDYRYRSDESRLQSIKHNLERMTDAELKKQLNNVTWHINKMVKYDPFFEKFRDLITKIMNNRSELARQAVNGNEIEYI